MNVNLLFLCFALLIFQAQPLPTTSGKAIRSFKIERVRRANYVPDGPRALKKAYAKFGIIPSGINFDAFDDFKISTSGFDRDGVSKAKQPNATGAVTNTPTLNDVEYLSPVTIGGQEFLMNFDTGSSDLWVFNTQLPEHAKEGHAIYDPTKSKSFSKLEGSTFNLTYGDGSFASGGVGVDTVNIGGAKVAKQAIGLPTEVSASFIKDDASDGLVGLGFDKLNSMKPNAQKTFFTNLAETLDEPIFAAQLKQGASGTYEFGIIDKSKFQGDLFKIPVNSTKGHWEFSSSKFRVGNDTSSRTIAKGSASAIADTGTTLMLVDEEIAKAYYQQVQGSKVAAQAGGYVFPCDTKLPDLYVSLADTHLARIGGELLSFTTVGSNTKTGEKLCFGAVQSNHGFGQQIFGDVFFKAVFVVFDLRGPSLHVAKHA